MVKKKTVNRTTLRKSTGCTSSNPIFVIVFNIKNWCSISSVNIGPHVNLWSDANKRVLRGCPCCDMIFFLNNRLCRSVGQGLNINDIVLKPKQRMYHPTIPVQGTHIELHAHLASTTTRSATGLAITGAFGLILSVGWCVFCFVVKTSKNWTPEHLPKLKNIYKTTYPIAYIFPHIYGNETVSQPKTSCTIIIIIIVIIIIIIYNRVIFHFHDYGRKSRPFVHKYSKHIIYIEMFHEVEWIIYKEPRKCTQYIKDEYMGS